MISIRTLSALALQLLGDPRDWWNRLGPGRIKEQAIATKMLSLAVNMGARSAVKRLQWALKAAGHPEIEVDGWLGERTITAVNQGGSLPLLAALRAEAAAYYRGLPHFWRFGRGWLNRTYAA